MPDLWEAVSHPEEQNQSPETVRGEDGRRPPAPAPGCAAADGSAGGGRWHAGIEVSHRKGGKPQKCSFFLFKVLRSVREQHSPRHPLDSGNKAFEKEIRHSPRWDGGGDRVCMLEAFEMVHAGASVHRTGWTGFPEGLPETSPSSPSCGQCPVEQ